MISVDLFMEVNGTLVWLVDDDEIDPADKVKRSFRNDVYPDEPPSVSNEEKARLNSPEPPEWNRNHWSKKSNFEWYSISRRRRYLNE